MKESSKSSADGRLSDEMYFSGFRGLFDGSIGEREAEERASRKDSLWKTQWAIEMDFGERLLARGKGVRRPDKNFLPSRR